MGIKVLRRNLVLKIMRMIFLFRSLHDVEFDKNHRNSIQFKKKNHK